MDQTLDQIIKERKIRYPGRGGRRGGNNAGNNNNANSNAGPKRGAGQRGGGRMVQRGGRYYSNQRRGNFAPSRAMSGMRRGGRGSFGGNFGRRGGRPQVFRQSFGANMGMMQQPRRGFQNNRGQFVGSRRGFFNRPAPFVTNQQMMNQNVYGVRQGGVMKRQMGGFRGSPVKAANTPTKLYISNLDFGVSNQDIKELFSEFGKIRRYGVNFAESGRSLGTAEVQYENRQSAMRAVQKYNLVPLDGRPMQLAVSGPQQQQVLSPVSPMQRQNSNQMSQRVPRQMMMPMRQQAPVRFFNRGGVTKKLVQRSKNTLIMRGRGRGGVSARGVSRNSSVMRRGAGIRGTMRGRGVGKRGSTAANKRGGAKRGGKKTAAPTLEQLNADLEAYTAKNE